ncbi:MAG TPA: type IV toxin-antitoxin system AbiEi family antitoxin domain-containing protein [Baekduia sp.]|nr:type IV toxin-antitoxin system AbiEi family antitoxin domain-containing protein [Baekduia sp.]
MALAALAAEQHGVVDLADLRSVGISERAAQARVASGRLHRVHRGVYAVGHPRLTRDGRRLAAVRAYGRAAVASHSTAAALWGLRRSGRLEVTVATARAARDGITPHETTVLTEDDCAVVRAVPVTSLARTLVDLADVVTPERLERMLDHAGRHEAFDLRAVHAALERLAGRRGGPRLRALLDTPSPGLTRSELEDRFLTLCRRARLPVPRLNTHLDLGHGRLVEVDALFVTQRVIVELDGAATHATTPAFHADRRRDTAAAAAGFRTLRYTWERVTQEPDRVAAELRSVLSRGGPAATR